MVMHKTITQNAVGEQESVLEDMYGLRASMDFLKTEDSDSKFSDVWANRLVMKTRYSLPLMDTLNNKNSFKIRWQITFIQLKVMSLGTTFKNTSRSILKRMYEKWQQLTYLV